MLSLSQTTGYAIRALSCLEGPGGRRILTKDIANHTGISQPYLAKILHALGDSGLVDAKRGYRGGFVLAHPAKEISLVDVVEAVEGEAWLGRCLLGLSDCSDEHSCPTHSFWKVERAKIERRLQRTSLAQVAGFERRSGRAPTCAGDAAAKRTKPKPKPKPKVKAKAASRSARGGAERTRKDRLRSPS